MRVGDDTKKTSKKAHTKKTRRFLLFGLSSFTVVTVLLLTIGKCWLDIYQKYDEKIKLKEQLLSLKDEEEGLKVDVEKLQDPDYIARYAREKFHYSKDGEFIIQVPK